MKLIQTNTASYEAKKIGFRALKAVCNEFGISKQRLINIYNHDYDKFMRIILGTMAYRKVLNEKVVLERRLKELSKQAKQGDK